MTHKTSITTLGEVSEYITSGSRDWSKFYSDSGALFIRTQDINKNRLDTSSSARVALPEKVEGKRTRLKKGDLLITITGANVGKCAVVDWDIEEAYVSQSVALVRLKDPLAAKFIFYQLISKDGHQSYLEKSAYGLGRPVLNLTNIREVPIVTTENSAQEEVISEIEKQFSRLDEAVTSLKRIQANLKRYKAAVLKAAVEGKLTEQWRKEHPDVEPANQLLKRILAERRAKWEAEELAKMKAKGIKPKDDSWKNKYKEPAGPDTASLPELAEGWVWAKIEQLSALVTDGDHNPPKRTKSGIRHFTAKNVRNWRFDPTGCTYISREDADKVFKRYLPLEGDLIVTCVGTVGRTAIVPENYEFSPDRNLAAIRPATLLLGARFMQIAIEGPSIQNAIKTASGSTAQPHLYLSDLRSIKIPVCSVREQYQIIAEIDRRLSVAEEWKPLSKPTLYAPSTCGSSFCSKLSSLPH